MNVTAEALDAALPDASAPFGLREFRFETEEDEAAKAAALEEAEEAAAEAEAEAWLLTERAGVDCCSRGGGKAFPFVSPLRPGLGLKGVLFKESALEEAVATAVAFAFPPEEKITTGEALSLTVTFKDGTWTSDAATGGGLVVVEEELTTFTVAKVSGKTELLEEGVSYAYSE